MGNNFFVLELKPLILNNYYLTQLVPFPMYCHIYECWLPRSRIKQTFTADCGFCRLQMFTWAVCSKTGSLTSVEGAVLVDPLKGAALGLRQV